MKEGIQNENTEAQIEGTSVSMELNNVSPETNFAGNQAYNINSVTFNGVEIAPEQFSQPLVGETQPENEVTRETSQLDTENKVSFETLISEMNENIIKIVKGEVEEGDVEIINADLIEADKEAAPFRAQLSEIAPQAEYSPEELALIEDVSAVATLAEKGNMKAKGSILASALSFVQKNAKVLAASGAMAVGGMGVAHNANAGPLDIFRDRAVQEVQIQSGAMQQNIQNEGSFRMQQRQMEQQMSMSRQQMEIQFKNQESQRNISYKNQLSQFDANAQGQIAEMHANPNISPAQINQRITQLNTQRAQMVANQEADWNSFAAQVEAQREQFNLQVESQRQQFGGNVQNYREQTQINTEIQRRQADTNVTTRVLQEGIYKIFKH